VIEPPAREEPGAPAGEEPEPPAAEPAPEPARRAKATTRKAPAKKTSRTRAPARKAAAPTPEPGPVQAVVFVLDGDEYALPIGQVQEVINYTEPRSISSEVSWVRGVINLRGTTLPVCDLAARLGRPRHGSGSGRIVVVQSADGPAGLVVDDVREVLTIVPAQLEELTVTDDPAITAIAKLGERLVVLVDAPAALAGAGLGPRP
jgi:purine-binding chemotaxis protein CheW